MAFDYIAEVLHHPLRKYSVEQKQRAITNTLIFLWENWRQHVPQWIKAGDIASLYIAAAQREKATDQLLRENVGVHGRAS